MKKSKPTYTADEIKQMCLNLEMEYETFKILTELIENELELYSTEEMEILTEASFIMFNRALLNGALKFMK